MNTQNPHPMLLDMFYRSAINSLDTTTKEVYQFIVKEEDYLESIAFDESHFAALMVNNSPFEKAVSHFHLPKRVIKKIVDQAQENIDFIVNQKCNNMKWIDCSNSNYGDKKLFLFLH